MLQIWQSIVTFLELLLKEDNALNGIFDSIPSENVEKMRELGSKNQQ